MSELQAQSDAARNATPQPITPHLVCGGAADAIDFYKKAFGAEELMRFPGPNGKLMHAAIRVNNAEVMIVDEEPAWGALSPLTLGGSPVTIHLNVANVDAFVERAVKAGALLRTPVADMFWGDRYGIIEDPFGHKWSISTHLRDMTRREIEDAMEKFMPSSKA